MPQSNRAFYDGRILHRERDLQLGLKAPEWPQKGCRLGKDGERPPPGAEPWQQLDGYLYRTIAPKRQPLWEVMLRFPNAPIYGLRQRRARLHPNKNRSNFHTLRVLGLLPDTDDDQGLSDRSIRDVYILHNGLNETKDAELHYHLASRLLAQSERPAVCILRPFPGHLTRYPYSDSFAERPLDTFLLDSGDLFRQFIRFMLETRWLMSILAPRQNYNVITGGGLVDVNPPKSSAKLAERIVGEWVEMDAASIGDSQRPRMKKRDVTESAVKRTVDILRDELLRWGPTSDDQIPTRTQEEAPAVHVVGYSLGGFLAQSVFFAWPYAVGSCITLFGGGELRKLAPTAFAQPEEWQSVLHALRYELDRAMGGPLQPTDHKISGVKEETFEYLFRVFYEVFLQYYQGSYKTRLAEFIQRMLFVTGGQDPIVRPGNILEAAPAEGVNLIDIAGMSHFPMKPKERVQKEQRDFWLEQLGQIVPAFAAQADERRRDVLHRSWLNADGSNLHNEAEAAYHEYKDQLDKIGEPPSQGVVTSGVPLSDRWFGKEIERICNVIDKGAHVTARGRETRRKAGQSRRGWVLVSRNEIPPVFQSAAVLRRYAAALHHSEDLAADEFWLALKRRRALEAGRSRVTLMVTDRARALAKHREPSIFPPRSETPGVPRLSAAQHKESLAYFEETWLKRQPDAIRTLISRDFRPDELGAIGLAIAQGQYVDPIEDKVKIPVRFLADAWMGIDEVLLNKLERLYLTNDVRGQRRRAEQSIVTWGTRLAMDQHGNDGTASGRQSATEILEEAIDRRTLLIVEFSRAGLNPRYRGRRLVSSKRAADVLVHWALAYCASVREDERENFGEDRDLTKPVLI